MEQISIDIDNLNLRDFIRIYLKINQKFQLLKQQNPANIHSAMYAVKNPEKVKQLKQNSYNKLQQKLQHTTP